MFLNLAGTIHVARDDGRVIEVQETLSETKLYNCFYFQVHMVFNGLFLI